MSQANSYRTEEDLFDGICRDAPGAFEAFFDRYADMIYDSAVKVTGDDETGKGILKAALARALSSISTLNNYRAMERHVLKVACGLLAEHKKNAGTTPLERASLMPAMEGGHLEPVTDWSLDPDEESHRSEEKLAIRELLVEMPIENSLVVVLHDMEEISQPDLAEAFQVKLKIIKERLHLGRLRLRKGLTEKLGSS
jgi:DNA-directed RNA polymerase specialized sigma24 family protein